MPKNKPLKLVIDTNLWISFIISNKQNLLDSLLFAEKARILFSTELFAEIQQTIAKPRLKRYFGTNALEEMLKAFEPFIDLIEVSSIIRICRSPKDNFLLHLPKTAKQTICSLVTKIYLNWKNLVKQKSKNLLHLLTKRKTTFKHLVVLPISPQIKITQNKKQTLRTGRDRGFWLYAVQRHQVLVSFVEFINGP